MKYKTFRVIVISCGAALTLGGVIYAARGCGSEGGDKPHPVADKPGPIAASPGSQGPSPQGTSPQVGQGAPAGPGQLRPMDVEILDRVKQGISGDKVKDAFPSRSYKVNLFKDAGETRVNRLKIDLDRDEKWDEKWTFSTEGGEEKVKRQVAPNDDESYTEDYRLRAGAWVKKE